MPGVPEKRVGWGATARYVQVHPAGGETVSAQQVGAHLLRQPPGVMNYLLAFFAHQVKLGIGRMSNPVAAG